MNKNLMQTDTNISHDKTGIEKVLHELKESEEKYRLLFEHITQGFALHEIILDHTGKPIDYKYITVNPAFEKLTGINADKIIGKRLLEVMPQTESYWIEKFGNVAITGESIIYENYSAEIGKYFETSVFCPKKGQFAVVFSDISERKHKEQKLHQKLSNLTSPLCENSTFSFTDLFNIEEIQRLQDQFAEAMGVASIITLPDGTPITKPSNFSNFCLLIRATEKGTKNCHYSDKVIGRQNTDGPIIQKCLSGGLCDAGASITVDGKHIANWLIGQVKDTSNNKAKVEEYAQLLNIENESLLNAFEEVTQMSDEKFRSIALMLFTLAGQLSDMAYQNVKQTRLIVDLQQTKEDLLLKNNELLTAEEELRASNEELFATNDALRDNLLELQKAEEKLKQDQILLRTIIDSIPDAIYVKDLNSRKLIANKADYKNMGLDNEKDAIGKNDFDIWPNDIAQALFNDDQQVTVHGKSIIDREEIIKTLNNEVVHLLTTKLPLFDQKGALKGLVGVGRNITKQKQAEEKLLTKNFELQSAEEEIRAANAELMDKNAALIKANKELQSAEEEIWATNDKLLAMNEALDQHINELEAAKLKVDEKELWLRESQRIGRIGTYQLNIKTNLWECSEVLDEIFGIDATYKKDIVGWFSLIHPEHAIEMLTYFEQHVVKGCNMFDKEYKIVRKNDQETRWLWGKGELTFSNEGHPIKMIGTIQDITEQKEAKLALKESAEFNLSLLQTIPFGLDVVDENGTILFINEILINSVGKEALGKKCYTIYSDNKTQCKGCPLKKRIKVGETAIIESPELINGRIFQISHTGMMFQGQKAILEIFQDVTESTNAQDAIIIKNAELQLAEEAIRAANEELTETNIDLSRRMVEIKKAKEQAEASEHSLNSLNKKMAELNHKLLQTNIELQLAKEKAEESNRLKTAFLHNISHEIRTPLNAIVGFSDLLSNREYPPEQMLQFTQIIHQGSEQLTSIITDIINIATIEAGQLKVFKKKTDINSILLNLFSQFNLKVSEKKLNLNYSLLQDANPTILTDETKVTQILSNLIDNGIKFTDKGNVTYGCNFKGNHLEFYVKDDGIGIEQYLHEKIFDRFTQGKTTINREYGGNGLGLSISKAYVELLDGKIWLESEVDKGSTFYFTIPYNKY